MHVLYVLATQADNLARYQLLYGSCLTLLLSFFYVTYSYWDNLLYAVSHTLPNVANICCDSLTFHVRATTLNFFSRLMPALTFIWYTYDHTIIQWSTWIIASTNHYNICLCVDDKHPLWLLPSLIVWFG